MTGVSASINNNDLLVPEVPSSDNIGQSLQLHLVTTFFISGKKVVKNVYMYASCKKVVKSIHIMPLMSDNLMSDLL